MTEGGASTNHTPVGSEHTCCVMPKEHHHAQDLPLPSPHRRPLATLRGPQPRLHPRQGPRRRRPRTLRPQRSRPARLPMVPRHGPLRTSPDTPSSPTSGTSANPAQGEPAASTTEVAPAQAGAPPRTRRPPGRTASLPMKTTTPCSRTSQTSPVFSLLRGASPLPAPPCPLLDLIASAAQCIGLRNSARMTADNGGGIAT